MANRLIIVGPGNGDIADFLMAWGRLLEVIRSYVRGRGDYVMYMDFLSTGLPYHLPFSFEPDVARDFASDLTRLGCSVIVVAAGD